MMNELLLSPELYPAAAVRCASARFQAICQIAVTEENGQILCRFEMLQPVPVQTAVREFENYLIDYINAEKLYADD